MKGKYRNSERLDHLMFDDKALDQRGNGVVVTYPDGTTRRVLNAILTRETAQGILLAAARPAVLSRITAETAKATV